MYMHVPVPVGVDSGNDTRADNCGEYTIQCMIHTGGGGRGVCFINTICGINNCYTVDT